MGFFSLNGGCYNTFDESKAADAEYRDRKAAEHSQAMRTAAAAQQTARRALAEKIVTVFIDRVNASIIRPGPVAEERECYDMAEELRQFKAELLEIAVDQLNVNNGCE